MKTPLQNITLSADPNEIETLRRAAAVEGTSFNKRFQQWVHKEAQRNHEMRVKTFRDTMKRLSYVRTDHKYTRDEMNER